MASIDSMTFDQAAYAPGDTVTLTVGYTPDTPSVVPADSTDTATLSDAAGNPLASQQATFSVNVPQPGDVLGNADSGGRAWVKVSDNGTVAVFTATA